MSKRPKDIQGQCKLDGTMVPATPLPPMEPGWVAHPPPCPPAKRRVFNLSRGGQMTHEPDDRFNEVDWETGKEVFRCPACDSYYIPGLASCKRCGRTLRQPKTDEKAQ